MVGWPLAGAPCVLAHVIIDGNTLEDQTWRDVDAFLMTRWRHPLGWEIKIDGYGDRLGRPRRADAKGL